MGQVKQILDPEMGLEATNTGDLAELYDGTIDELEHCGKVIPESGLNDLLDDWREGALLELEAQILHQAANVQIQTKDDISHLMDIWAKAVSTQSGEQASPSDRIVMNIFRHLSEGLLVKG